MSANGKQNGHRFSFEQFSQDMVIGRMIDGGLQTQVSVRKGMVVLSYYHAETKRGFEVAYEPRSMEAFNDIVSKATKVALGRG